MAENIRLLCMLSLFFGAVLSLMQPGSIKSITEILCTAILILVVLSPIKGFDYDSVALESAKLHELEMRITDRARSSEERMNRLVIQDECAEYIKDKAGNISDEALDVRVTAQWSLDGLWVPYSAVLSGEWSERDRQTLGELIQSSLGIPLSRQEWENEG